MISREMLQENQQADETYNSRIVSPCIGRIVSNGKAGEILVEVNGSGARAARLLSTVNRHELMKLESEGREVLIIFEQGDPERPIIIGVMEDPIENLFSMEITVEAQANTAGMKGIESPTSKPKEARMDGKRITIEAQDEVVLKCGSGSITLRKDGKIVVKGTHLLSRSSGPIRVKGARVDIN